MTDDLSKEKTLIRKDAVKGATRLGRYTLGKRLGVGGMAEVYLAEQDGPQQFRKRVVVKRILASLAADPQFVQMFVREAQVAARLSHGNVVQILELGEHTDGNQTEYFIAMEYIDGLTLQRLAQSSWDQGKAVPVDVVLRACADAARGLHAAHTLTDEDGKIVPLVHRDVSPDNLMVSRDGVTKVLDFGIAKGDLGGPKTKTGNVRGKIPYMAPEQVTGQGLDSRSDLYALGVSMYYLLCGERPFDRGTDYHTMQAVLTEQPKSPRSLNPAIPEALETLMLQLLEKDRDKRPASAAELANDLEALTQPGTGAGRKTMIAFVAAMVDQNAAAGNPLSEADGARATVPLELASPLLDASAVSSVDAAKNAPPAALSIEMTETLVPRQVTLPGGPDAGAVGEPQADAAIPTATQTSPARAISKPSEPPVPPDSASPIVPVPVPVPDPKPPATAVALTSHPVMDMLTPKREGLPAWVALLGVLAGMALLGAVLAFIGYKVATARDDVVVTAPADAGASADAPDAGFASDAGLAVLASVPDAGATAAVDAGSVAVAAAPDAGFFVDAGAVAVVPSNVVDAGSVPRVDAGTAPPRPTRLVVKATAPDSIRWDVPGGSSVGRGNATLSLPKGTRELIARDPSRMRSDTLAIAIDAGNELKGSVDYTPLLTATLAVTNVGDVKVMLGDEEVLQGKSVRAVPGSYTVRLVVGDTRTITRVSLRAGETTTLDVQKVLKKQAR